MVSYFPGASASAATSVERAPPVPAWRQEEPHAGWHSLQEPVHRAHIHGHDTAEAADAAKAPAQQPVSPSPTDGSTLGHSNEEVSLRPVEVSSESGSVAVSEDAQQRAATGVEETAQCHAREDDGREAVPQMQVQAGPDEVGGAEKIAASRHAAMQRSPRRPQHGRNDENEPQGRGWFRAGPRRGGSAREDAVTAAQKLDFESARPSPIAPLGKAAAANWLRSRR